MTPVETYLVIKAAAWKFDEEQRDLAWLAWHVAALSRAKRLPALSKLLKAGKAEVLSGEELKKRREEFKQMKERIHAKIPVR